MVRELIHTFAALAIGSLIVGTLGSGLAIAWTTAATGHWPDRPTLLGIMKIYYGAGVIGILVYLRFKRV
jgi:hypothetical protein